MVDVTKKLDTRTLRLIHLILSNLDINGTNKDYLKELSYLIERIENAR